MRRPTLVDRVMQEVTIYGGLPLRRADVYALASEELGERAGGRYGAQWFAFGGPAVDLTPWSLSEAREIFND